MPFTVITLQNAPPSLRGDLSKWMQQIATGIYVGNFNARIREKIWERVKQSIGYGQATLSYSYRNEIGYQFDTWNTEQKIVDWDGIPLVCYPVQKALSVPEPLDFSKVARMHQWRKFNGKAPEPRPIAASYVVLDLETDGLDARQNRILEIGAIRISEDEPCILHNLIQYDRKLPGKIRALTGITEQELCAAGIALEDALHELIPFLGDLPIVGYGLHFDIQFLNVGFQRHHLPALKNPKYDLLAYVKREKPFLPDYHLETVLQAYGLPSKVQHRALEDAENIVELSKKVKRFIKKLNEDR